MGKVISNEDDTDILLASLPLSYNQLCSSISNSAQLGAMTLTADLFKGIIIDEYTRHKIKKQANTKDEAFTAEASKSKKQCSNCNKHGYVKANRWAKGGGKEGQ